MKENRNEFLLRQKQRLIISMLSTWHRRGSKLLHIGLEHDVQPQFFWDSGFEVSAVTSKQSILEEAQARNGKMIDYYLCSETLLPFDDKSFDYAVLTHSLAGNEEAEEFIEEAMRVVAKGILIIENNSWALHRENPKMSPYKLSALAYKTCTECYRSIRSNLWAPVFTWTANPLYTYLHKYPIPLPIGTIMAIRIEHEPFLMTPLSLRVKKAEALVAE